jgi:hypothetical protein
LLEYGDIEENLGFTLLSPHGLFFREMGKLKKREIITLKTFR